MTNGEIAEKLNISPATLSLIINNKGSVSQETRNRVIAELKRMGYGHLLKKTEKTLDKNLSFVVYKKKNTILGDKASYIFLIEGIEKVVTELGYNLFLNIINEGDDVRQQVARLQQMNSEGMILYATEMIEEDMQAFEEYCKPIVVIDNDFAHLNCTCVYSNYILAGYQAITHLVNMGHTRIGYLKSKTRLRCFNLRETGYRQALSEYGLTFDEKDIWDIDIVVDQKMQEDLEQRVKESRELPTAFVSDEDILAVSAVKCFTEKGIRIPENVSVIGYNDCPIAETSDPPLSTIDGFGMEYIRKAVSELLFEIEHTEYVGKGRGCKVMMGTTLVQRQSVRNLREDKNVK